MTHLGKSAVKIHCGQHPLTKQVQKSSAASAWTLPTSPFPSSSVSISTDYRIFFWVTWTCPSVTLKIPSTLVSPVTCCLAYFPYVEPSPCFSNFINHLKAFPLECKREWEEFCLWEGELEFLLSRLTDISILKYRQMVLGVSQGCDDIAGLV